MRLNKFIADSGYCSRREADRYIEQGRVLVNGRKAAVGDQFKDGDEIKVNGVILEGRSNDIVLAFNKPVGITSTTDPLDKTNIIDYVNYSERIFPIGRLDKDSQGLIFLTNNGDLVNKILRAGNSHEKEYVVTVDKPITEDFVKKMSEGIPILGQMTKKCKVKQESHQVFRITLIQGLNRQIRRMTEYLGYNVTKLERVRIMHVDLKGIPLGEWRELDEVEMTKLNKMIEKSRGEAKKKSSSEAPSSSSSKSSSHSKPTSKPKPKPRHKPKPSVSSFSKNRKDKRRR